jgi:hypothetical protein
VRSVCFTANSYHSQAPRSELQDVRPRRSPGTDGRLRPMLAGTPAGLVSSMAPRGTANSRGEQVPSRWRKLLGDVVGQGNTVRARSAKGFPGPKPEESYNWMLGLQRVPISGVIRAHEEQFEWLEQPMQRPPAIDWQHRPLPNSPVRVVRYLSDWEPQPPLGVRHATKGRQPRSDLGTIHGQGDQVRARSDFGVPSEEESGVPGDEEVTHRPDVRRERDHIDKASDGDEDRGSQERSRVLEEGPSLPENKEEATLAKASEESERPTTGTEASVPSPVPKPAAPRSPRTHPASPRSTSPPTASGAPQGRSCSCCLCTRR